jgi:hypothetical protein
MTDQCLGWYLALDEDELVAVNAAVDLLAERGPALGRPTVGEIDLSRETGEHPHNMKELRVGDIRVLFIFDPRRTAILLVGGSKSGNWQNWYREAIPEAERLYVEYLGELKREGILK